MKLSFICNQDLENFTPSKKGYYCSSCKKNLVDFRGQSENTIRVYHSNHPNTCGIYDLKTIDESIITKINFNFLYKPIFFLSTVLPFFHYTATKAQTVPIEIVEESTTKTNTKSISKDESTTLSPQKNNRKNSRKLIRSQRSWYLTWRFPFIKRNVCELSGWY